MLSKVPEVDLDRPVPEDLAGSPPAADPEGHMQNHVTRLGGSRDAVRVKQLFGLQEPIRTFLCSSSRSDRNREGRGFSLWQTSPNSSSYPDCLFLLLCLSLLLLIYIVILLFHYCCVYLLFYFSIIIVFSDCYCHYYNIILIIIIIFTERYHIINKYE